MRMRAAGGCLRDIKASDMQRMGRPKKYGD